MLPCFRDVRIGLYGITVKASVVFLEEAEEPIKSEKEFLVDSNEIVSKEKIRNMRYHKEELVQHWKVFKQRAIYLVVMAPIPMVVMVPSAAGGKTKRDDILRRPGEVEAAVELS